MPAPKGNNYNPAGRPKGARNQRTEEWEYFSEWMMTAGLDRFKQEIELLEGKDFIYVVKDLMEYFKPKLARQEVTGKDGKDLIPQPIMDLTKGGEKS